VKAVRQARQIGDRQLNCRDSVATFSPIFLPASLSPTVLLKAALTHVQFETIHPFQDGNYRLGRLLIALLLCEQKVLREPMLYLSLYFKTHRQYYYEL
jgi:hypothetical protein